MVVVKGNIPKLTHNSTCTVCEVEGDLWMHRKKTYCIEHLPELGKTLLDKGIKITPEQSINEPQHIENPIPKEETKMFFKYDEKEAGGFGEMLPAGEYEVIISETDVTTSTSGNPMIKATLTIRTDVEQEGGKRKIFENLVGTEKAMFKFHQIAKALQWGQGEGAANIEEFADRILYQQVRVKLKQGKEQNGYAAKNEVVSYLTTEFPTGDNGVSPAYDPYKLDDGKPIDISDDDLPF